MKRRSFVLAGCSAALLTACGGGSNGSSAAQNRFKQTNLAASTADYRAQFIDPEMVNAWGIAIRPAGAGGHFWVGAGGKSWQFIGDVTQSTDPALRSLSQDGLKKVSIAGADALTDSTSLGKVTGVAYCGAPLVATPVADALFRVNTQTAGATTFDGSARFVFVTDSGRIAAWTERASDGRIVRVDGPAAEMFDGSAQGMAFFGVALKPDAWDRLWVTDFGARPRILTFNAQWTEVATTGFANPFATGADGSALPGDPVPFNIQAFNRRVFVTYAISREDPLNPGSFLAAEEDALDAKAEAASGNLFWVSICLAIVLFLFCSSWYFFRLKGMFLSLCLASHSALL